MIIDFLLETFKKNCQQEALVWCNKNFSYGWLYDAVFRFLTDIKSMDIKPGSVVELHADFSPSAIAMLLALIEHQCIVIPTTKSILEKRGDFQQIAEVEVIIEIDINDKIHYSSTLNKATHPIFKQLRNAGAPGLVLFSSGSTGKPKAAVHNFASLLEKFKQPRSAKRIINFLLFDHIGGLNTLLHTLANGGCVITLNERTPSSVCQAIEKHHVEILPTSPTFINLLLLSNVYKNYDLSSLELITYGTEPMPESTLKRCNNVLPNVRLTQTYGLSELGILRAKSKSSDSLYMKIGGEGYQTRIVNGLLEIKAECAMLGYLNAENPFTEDGWFKTGDAVELDGEYLRILGRTSEMINVGGEKVYPAEVESVIQTMEGVLDVVVAGEAHPIIGQIVKAKATLATDESLGDFRHRLRAFCKNKLAAYKIPQKIIIADTFSHNERFKRIRKTI